MKERPIVFTSESVRAILDGRKFQTRRVLRRQPSGGVKPERVVVGKRWSLGLATYPSAGRVAASPVMYPEAR